MANTDALRRTYTEHYAHIRSKVAPGRLLNFHVKEGWGPLCDFLGEEVPQGEAFPRINEARWTVNLHYYLVVLRLWHIGRKYLGVVVAVGIAYGLARWLRK
jgi:hypothetical protein